MIEITKRFFGLGEKPKYKNLREKKICVKGQAEKLEPSKTTKKK